MRSATMLTAMWSRVATLTSPLRHIHAKIIVPYAILGTVVAIVGTYLVTQLVAGSLEERFDNQLAEAGRVAGDAVVRKEQEQLEVARAIAYTQGVPSAAQNGDAARLEGLISPIVANEQVDRTVVVDANGKRLAAMSGEEDPSDDQTTGGASDPSQWWIVQQVLGGADELGDKYAALVQDEGGFFFYTAAPLTAEDQTVGAVLVGTSLESLVREMKSQALADITIYSYDGVPIASTFVLEHAEQQEATLKLSSTAASNALNLQDSSLRESHSLFGRDYGFAYGRLQIRQNVVGLYSVSLPANFIVSAGATTRTSMSIVFGIVISAVLIIGYLLAHRITRPIQQLVAAARLVAAGNLETRSGVQSSDEIGLLAHSFDQMTESLAESAERLRLRHISTIQAVTSAVAARDPYTLGHSIRVGRLASTLGRQLGLSEDILGQIEIGGYLHDIGKVGVRDSILLKPGPLTLDEQVAIDRHTLVACRILESVDLSPEVWDFVRSHHERLDGSGYPNGLRGEEIPLVARIAAVADVYDAMTTDRPYRAALDPEVALAELKSQAGNLLDTGIVDALAAILPEWEHMRRSDATLLALEADERGEQCTRQAA